jgi:hypothetical protein
MIKVLEGVFQDKSTESEFGVGVITLPNSDQPPPPGGCVSPQITCACSCIVGPGPC